MLINVAISGDRNMMKKEAKKIPKHKQLTILIRHMWNVKTKVIPVIRGANGTISKSFRKYLSNIPGKHKVKELHKTAILGTACILWKVLTSKYTAFNIGNNITYTNYKLYYNRSIITNQTIHNNRPDKVMFDKTIKEAYLIDVAIPKSHNLHSTITKKLQKYTDLTEALIRIWQLKMAYIIPLAQFTTGIIPNKLHESLKLLNLHPTLYILMQEAVISNTHCIVRKFLAEQ
jgi:hypothetical protein